MKNKILTNIIVILGLILSTFIFSNLNSTNTANPESVNLTVQVNHAIDDYPIEGAEVTVNGNNSYTGYTNKNGQAFFNGIPNDAYCIDAFFRNLKGHEDNIYLTDSTYFITIYISQNDSLCP